MEAIVDLTGKSFLITGARQSVGRELAEKCVRLGASAAVVNSSSAGPRELDAATPYQVLTASLVSRLNLSRRNRRFSEPYRQAAALTQARIIDPAPARHPQHRRVAIKLPGES